MTFRRRSSGSLTPEDAALWGHVTDSVHPMRRSRRVRQGAQAEPLPVPMENGSALSVAPVSREAVDLAPLATTTRGKPRWQPLVTEPPPRPKSAPGVQPPFDRRQARKIATGKVEIEGRIDLHGLRENEAHRRLRGYLRQAQAQGKRTVLVITGKGRDSDDPYAPFDPAPERTPRGVLRRNVPRWLAEPDLAPLVVSYTTAHTRHGGDGALYVHLRRA